MISPILSKKKICLDELFSSKGRSKIIQILALKGELNITSIVRLTGLNHIGVRQHLKFLKSIDFVQEKIYGRIRIYRYKTENIQANALKNLLIFWDSNE